MGSSAPADRTLAPFGGNRGGHSTCSGDLTIAGSGDVVIANFNNTYYSTPTVTISGNGANNAADEVDGSGLQVTTSANTHLNVNGDDDTVLVSSNSDVGVIGDHDTASAYSDVAAWIFGSSPGSGGNVFVASTDDTVFDNDNGLLIQIGGGIDLGVLTVVRFAEDPHGIIHLIEGAGGYTSASAAAAAITSDGNGGSRLSLGAEGSLDLVGVAPGSVTAGQFRIN